jgi:PIF1-like helicase
LFLKGGKNPQLIMLLHGPGGSGKSRVITLVIAYAQEFCNLLSHPFTIRTIVVTAMSGVAATLIHGKTTHMSMGLNRQSPNDAMIKSWSDTRLVIIDECSFASEGQFNKMEECARLLKNVAFQYYGGLNVVFAGDFSQLEPPCRTPIYEGKECPAFHGLLNTFIELDGQHRFKTDPIYGAMMLRFRNGVPTTRDIDLINETCLMSSVRLPPPNIPVAVYRNRNRDAINCAQFESFCERNKPVNPTETLKKAILVFMDNLEMRDGAKTYVRVLSNRVKSYFYRNCGEHACKTGDMATGRVDPVLKLYYGCPMMLTENKNVPSGQANGSRLRLKRVKVKNGERPMLVQLLCGTKIRAYLASQIVSLTVRHEVEDIKPEEFEVVPKSFTFSATVTLDYVKRAMQMKGTQFPIISNGVTTGHKLQGCSLDWLAVFELFYGQNWIYVILSRVRTMQGLYLSEALSTDVTKYAMSAAMKKMIATFQERIGLKLYDNDEYERELLIDRSNREDRGVNNVLYS